MKLQIQIRKALAAAALLAMTLGTHPATSNAASVQPLPTMSYGWLQSSSWYAGALTATQGYGCTYVPGELTPPNWRGTCSAASRASDGVARFHTGIDLADPRGGSYGCGTAIITPVPVTVEAIGGKTAGGAWYAGQPNGWAGAGFGELYPTLRLPDGHDVIFGHVQKIYVSAGQTYPAGTRIADIGTLGNSSGCHLHFEVRTLCGGLWSDIDPTPYLNLSSWRADIPVVADFGRTGADRVGVVRAGTTDLQWFLPANASGPTSFSYGGRDDIPVVGTWTKGGTLGIGVVRREPQGLHWLLRNSVSPGAPQVDFYWGLPTDTPVLGDWSGIGNTGLGVVRQNPNNGQLEWILADGIQNGTPHFDFYYGGLTDKPVVGVWTANPGSVGPAGAYLGVRFGVGVVRESGGSLTWLLRKTASGGAPDIQFPYGPTGTTPVVGDFGGTGTSSNGIYIPALPQPGSYGHWQLRNSLGAGWPDQDFFYGAGSYVTNN